MKCLVVLGVVALAACGAVRANHGDDCASAQCDAPPDAAAACSANVDCTDPAAPICDPGAHECRACTADSECASGVCLEAQGVCEAETDVSFVAAAGTDSGSCSRGAPCATLPFAIAGLGARHVIHVLGGTLPVNNLTISGTFTLDGEDTILGGGSDTTTLTIAAPATVTIEGFRFVEPVVTANLPAIATSTATTITLYNIDIGGNGGPAIAISGAATVTLSHSHVGNLTALDTHVVSCPDGSLLTNQNTFDKTLLTSDVGSCRLTATRNRFDSDRDGSVQVFSNSQLVMENNLIIHEVGTNDSITATGVQPGSTIRFNTIVNTTAVPSDGSALGCDASVEVTSNIFAYNSRHPITGEGCAPRYSVFDTVSTTSAGTGNQVISIDAIFANRNSGDYHLATSSIARSASEPGQDTMVKIDLDGGDRPNPAGTSADSGAFEAP